MARLAGRGRETLSIMNRRAMRDGHWEYTIRAYRPTNQGGDLVMETVHVGTVSRDLELAVFRERRARGEIGVIEIIAHVEPYGITRG